MTLAAEPPGLFRGPPQPGALFSRWPFLSCRGGPVAVQLWIRPCTQSMCAENSSARRIESRWSRILGETLVKIWKISLF